MFAFAQFAENANPTPAPSGWVGLAALAGPAALCALQRPTQPAPPHAIARGDVAVAAAIAAVLTALPSFVAWSLLGDQQQGSPWHVPTIVKIHLDLPGWLSVWGTMTFGIAAVLLG